MVQRLCGICPVSHHLAASKAMDRVLGAHPVTPSAEKIRRLMHYGQILQSHALHFFHLSSPDLLFGFDSEVAQRNIVGVIEKHPDIAKQGRDAAQVRPGGDPRHRRQARARHRLGARRHEQALSVAPSATLLQRDIGQTLAWAQDAVTIARQLHESNAGAVRRLRQLPLEHAVAGARRRRDGPLRRRAARARCGRAASCSTARATSATCDLIDEEVRPWTYMKFPHLRSLGREAGWYRVGPLARVQNCDFIPTPLAEAQRQAFVAWGHGAPVHATLAYHWARMIEVLHAAEVIERVARRPRHPGRRADVDRRSACGEGVGIIEAPRGTLIHHYRVGDDDLVTMCNLIVSTTHNNQAMNEAVRSVAREYLDGQELTEGLLNRIEVAIRAYDPCLSCATHALGQMPLDVSLARRRRHGARPRAQVARRFAAARSRRARRPAVRDGSAARLRLGQCQPRRRRARAAVHRTAARAAGAGRARAHRLPRRLPAAGRACARPGRPRARALRRREPELRRALRGRARASTARPHVHHARHVARRAAAGLRGAACERRRRPARCWRSAASASSSASRRARRRSGTSTLALGWAAGWLR